MQQVATLCSLCFPKKKQVASSCDGPGDNPLHGTASLLLPSSPLSAQGVRAFPDERGRAKLGSFQRGCGLPSHSPWQFDCSTWRTPSSGHSGLVDHGCRHILLGRALVPIQTNQVISTVSFPSALFAAESNYAYLWAEEVHRGAKVNKISLWHAYHERRHTALSSYSQKTPSLSQGAALVQIIVSMIRERMNVGGEGRERGGGREGEKTRGMKGPEWEIEGEKEGRKEKGGGEGRREGEWGRESVRVRMKEWGWEGKRGREVRRREGKGLQIILEQCSVTCHGVIDMDRIGPQMILASPASIRGKSATSDFAEPYFRHACWDCISKFSWKSDLSEDTQQLTVVNASLAFTNIILGLVFTWGFPGTCCSAKLSMGQHKHQHLASSSLLHLQLVLLTSESTGSTGQEKIVSHPLQCRKLVVILWPWHR